MGTEKRVGRHPGKLSGKGGGADELQIKRACCPDLHLPLRFLPALSPCVISSSLSEWHMQMDIAPDSTTDLYNLQVSPMPSTSEGLYLGPWPVSCAS